jgi:hypothetical protein
MVAGSRQRTQRIRDIRVSRSNCGNRAKNDLSTQKGRPKAVFSQTLRGSVRIVVMPACRRPAVAVAPGPAVFAVPPDYDFDAAAVVYGSRAGIPQDVVLGERHAAGRQNRSRRESEYCEPFYWLSPLKLDGRIVAAKQVPC